jgi:hypothetical protein
MVQGRQPRVFEAAREQPNQDKETDDIDRHHDQADKTTD